MADLRIGTCSWKYDSWAGLVYPEAAGKGNGGHHKKYNLLKEYARIYNSVEVDQWFWSAHPGGKVVLPRREVVEEYAESVPDDFRFTIKVPNSVTLTHYYRKKNSDPLMENSYFLCPNFFGLFLDSVEPLLPKIGALIFQFEYLNQLKMPGLHSFLKQMDEFLRSVPRQTPFAIETRNQNYLKPDYFDFLETHDLSHVFLQGYYMPPIHEVYGQFMAYIQKRTVIRLHGPNRKEIEEQTGQRWNRVVEPKDHELNDITNMLLDLETRDVSVYLNVNNHYEGSAPLSIEKIQKRLQQPLQKAS